MAEGPARLARTAQRAQRVCYARSTAVRQAMTSHQARPPQPSRSAPPRAGPRSSTKVGGTWAVGVQRTAPACPTLVSGAWATSGLRRRCLFPRLGRPAPSLPTLSFPLLQRPWQHLFWRLPGASSPVSPLPPRDLCSPPPSSRAIPPTNAALLLTPVSGLFHPCLVAARLRCSCGLSAAGVSQSGAVADAAAALTTAAGDWRQTILAGRYGATPPHPSLAMLLRGRGSRKTTAAQASLQKAEVAARGTRARTPHPSSCPRSPPPRHPPNPNLLLRPRHLRHFVRRSPQTGARGAPRTWRHRRRRRLARHLVVLLDGAAILRPAVGGGVGRQPRSALAIIDPR